MPNYDFMLELRLKHLDRNLATRHVTCMALFDQMLKKLVAVFPHFTDHTLLHTLNITNISNQLLRKEVEKLNAEEIYIYLMALALHDIGMGISNSDLDLFIQTLALEDYVKDHPEKSKADIIREFHHDFSAAYIQRYWQILDIPNERYAYAIAETSRGHRRTDLMNEKQYPVNYELDDGKQVNLAFLGALIRLADELDIAADRNPELLYNEKKMTHMTESEIFEFDRHKAIHSVDFTEKEIIVSCTTNKDDIRDGIETTIYKLIKTFDYCVDVIHARSHIRLDFERITFILNEQEQPIG